MASQTLVNSGSSNGFLPDGTKPLPEPMLTSREFCGINLRAISWWMPKLLFSIMNLKSTGICFKSTATSPKTQWVNSNHIAIFNRCFTHMIYNIISYMYFSQYKSFRYMYIQTNKQNITFVQILKRIYFTNLHTKKVLIGICENPICPEKAAIHLILYLSHKVKINYIFVSYKWVKSLTCLSLVLHICISK